MIPNAHLSGCSVHEVYVFKNQVERGCWIVKTGPTGQRTVGGSGLFVKQYRDRVYALPIVECGWNETGTTAAVNQIDCFDHVVLLKVMLVIC